MSTATTPAPVRSQPPPGGETRIRIPNASWDLYRNFVERLPESSPIRVAFDGRSMEIMTKGPVHDHFGRLLEQFVLEVAGAVGILIKPQGETTWIRPEIERGIEADNCYYVDPAKIAAALQQIARRSNDVADFPNPDLAIEVDISPPQADRLGIYASLGVAEIWVFDGEKVTIRRLTGEGRYTTDERSAFLPIRAAEIGPWLLEENLLDLDAWRRRVRAWAGNLREVG
ncbi:MAG: Uma2 family endonuclease [Isosphaeraceae bacterium]